MKYKKHILLVTLLMGVIFNSEGMAANSIAASLPEFMEKAQLTQWRTQEKSIRSGAAGSNEIAGQIFYTGRPYDSGVYLFKYRRYDPNLSRWLSADPSGFPDGANNFLYSGNPLSGFDADGLSWSNWDFVYHYYFGGGTTVTLGQIGLLSAVQTEANRYAVGGASRFRIQIQSKAQKLADDNQGYNGALSDSFSNSYNFGDVIYSLGSATLSASFSGQMTSTPTRPGRGGTFQYDEGGTLAGDMTVISFSDTFTDPLGVIQAVTGSSNPPGAPSWWQNIANLNGTAFTISGEWTENYNGSGTYE